MEESVGFKYLFYFAEVFLCAVFGGAGEQYAHVGVAEVFLDGFAHRDDVGFEMTARPEIHLSAVGHLQVINLGTAITMEVGSHVLKAKYPLAQKVQVGFS